MLQTYQEKERALHHTTDMTNSIRVNLWSTLLSQYAGPGLPLSLEGSPNKETDLRGSHY